MKTFEEKWTAWIDGELVGAELAEFEASLPDMAAVLGCSVGTVKSRLHHALEKLRKMKMNLPDSKGHQQL